MLGKLVSGGRRLVLIGAIVGLLLATGAFIGSSNPAGWTCTSPPLLCTLASGTYPIGISLSSTLLGGIGWSIENNGSFLVREHNPSIGPGYPRTEIGAGAGKVSFLAVDGDGTLMPSKVRVGIGTTQPTWDLTFGKNSVREIGVEASDDNTAYDFKIHAGSGGGLLETQNGGDLYLYGGKKEGPAGSDGDVILAHSGQEVIGKVGIGTSTPGWKLDVNGNIHIPQGNYLSFLNRGWAIGKDHNAAVGDEESLQIEGWGGGTWGTSQKRTFQVISQIGMAPYTNHVVFQANLNDGNVGIGTTEPEEKLDVDGNVVIRGKALEVTGGAGSYIKVGKPELGYCTTFSYEYDQLSGMFDTFISNPCGKGIDCDLILDFPYGNVGIGTTDPQSTLQVDGDPGYLQIDSMNSAPPAADCDSDDERGRMVLDFGSNRLYVCNGASRGWDYTALND